MPKCSGITRKGIQCSRFVKNDDYCYQHKTFKNIECAICLDIIDEKGSKVSKTKCNHIFHKSCLDKWIYAQSKCPTCPCCRSSIKTRLQKLTEDGESELIYLLFLQEIGIDEQETENAVNI